MFYKQPRYFGSFQCIGGDCPDNCCYGWHILWKADEVNKVKSAENASPELLELAEKYFQPVSGKPDKIEINYAQNGKCPFETEDGLCRIQKELGAEYLSETCKTYPRTHIFTNSIVYRFCRMSCPVIMDKLLNDEKCMDLVSVSTVKDKGKNFHSINKPINSQKYPEQKYYENIFEFFYELISDKLIDIDSAVIIGAMAANALTKIIGREEYDSIPGQLKALKKQIHNGNMLKSVSEIKPNYELKFGLLPKILEDITENSVSVLLADKDGRYNIDMYELAEARLREQLNEREFFLRNVALQFLFELNVPFCKENQTLFENYSLYAVTFACVKMNLTASMVTEKPINMKTYNHEFICDGDKKFTVLTSLINRALCHETSATEKIMSALKEKGFDKAAYLALLIK